MFYGFARIVLGPKLLMSDHVSVLSLMATLEAIFHIVRDTPFKV